jgi:hypothetical protein
LVHHQEDPKSHPKALKQVQPLKAAVKIGRQNFLIKTTRPRLGRNHFSFQSCLLSCASAFQLAELSVTTDDTAGPGLASATSGDITFAAYIINLSPYRTESLKLRLSKGSIRRRRSVFL